MANVTVEARNAVGNPCLVMLQDDTWELNIWATTDELGELADIGKMDLAITAARPCRAGMSHLGSWHNVSQKTHATLTALCDDKSELQWSRSWRHSGEGAASQGTTGRLVPMVGQVLFGLAFMVIAGVIVVTNLGLKRRGHRTTGTVAGLERDWNPDPDTPGYTYWPVLEFQTDRGQDVRTRAKVSGSPQVGRRVRILYDPDNPNTAEIDTIWGRQTIVFGAFALIGIYLIVSAIL